MIVSLPHLIAGAMSNVDCPQQDVLNMHRGGGFGSAALSLC